MLTAAGWREARDPRPHPDAVFRPAPGGGPVRGISMLLCVALLVGASSAGGETPAPAAPGDAGAPASGDGKTPTPVIERFHAALLAVAREAESLGYEGRFRRLAPAVEEAFDLDYMAEKVVGGPWKRLAPTEQQRWRLTFGQFMKANYAGRFNRFSGQSFETLGNEPGAHGTAIVRTRLHNPAGEDVDLNYRLRTTPAGWRTIDIFLKGTVSELALRRSEYAAVLRREGFDALLKIVEGRIAELAAGKE